VLSAAFNGANWSLDAPPFGVGDKGPGTGMTVIALAPKLIDPDYESRLGAYVERLSGEYDVHIPGRAKAEARSRSERDGIAISKSVHDRIAARLGS
jgi:(2R)-3-sulfolactate dehydrogenase (NADP+)